MELTKSPRSVSSQEYNGWYPEVMFLTIEFFNSTVSAALIPNTSVFETFDTPFF